MNVNTIHPPADVHRQKIVRHHPIVLVIEVATMNMSDQEVIRNHHAIEMINMSVTHASKYVQISILDLHILK